MKKIKSTWKAAVWATVFVVALVLIANWVGSSSYANSMTFKGALKDETGNIPDGSYDFRVRGYNAINSSDQIFQVDLKKIKVQNSEFSLTVQVQEELRNVPAIVEICADTKQNNNGQNKAICTESQNENSYDVALCPYYVPARATGMFGWLVTKKTFAGRSNLNCPELKNGSTVMGDSFIDRANKLGVNVSLFGNSADYFSKQFITNNNITQQNDLPQTLSLIGNILSISSGNSVVLPQSQSGGSFVDTDTTYSAGAGLVLNSTTFSRQNGSINGQIEVWDGSTWSDLAAGSNGQVLTIVGGVPAWQSGGAEADGVIGNEITDVNTSTGLVRTGTGTGIDPYVVALTTTGVGAGTYNNVTVNTYGRVTSASNVAYLTSETDGIVGNEIVNLTGADGKGVLTRAGTGTSGDPYTLSVATCALNQIFKFNGTNWACAADTDTDTTYSNGNGLSLAGTTFSVNSPTCSGSDKLQWNGTAFICSSDVDTDTDTTNFNVAAQGTGGSQNVSSGGTVTFNNGTGTTATRSGSTVTYSLNDTAVSPSTYGTNASVAQITVDQQGRITGASSVAIDFAGNAVTSVTAGNGLTNGGGPGAVTINVGAGNGITVNADDITIDTLTSADGLSSTTSNGSGLEVLSSGLGLLQGCSDNQILKWNETSDVWGCGADNGSAPTIGTIDSQTKSADGAVFASSVLYLQTADGSNPGLVSTSTQTFAGNKTFSGALIATCSNTSTNVLCDGGNTRGAGIVLGANDNFGLDFETNNSTRMSIANSGAITIGATTIDQAITIDNGTGALSLGNSSDAKTINVGTGTGIDTINIGTGATAADVITFGNTGVATTLTFNSGISTTTAATLNLNSVTSGNGLVINTTALTSGNAFQVVGPSSRSLIRVQNNTSDPLDDERVIIGQGGLAASKPDSLARDQLYVFGRINYSWNMFNSDFVTAEGNLTADGNAYNARFDEDAGASGQLAATSAAGVSGMVNLSNPTTPAANENEWWGTNGVGVTERSLNPVLESRLAATNQADHRSMVGFLNIATNANFDADTNTSTNEIMFRKTAAGTNWETVTRAGGTEQICTSSVTTNAYHTLRIEVDNATPQVHFYADGTLVKTHTNSADGTCNGGGVANTLPATGTRLGWYVGNAITATTDRATSIDYMRVWSDDPPTDLLNQALSTPIVAGASTEQVNELEQKTVDLIADQNYLADIIDELRDDVSWLKAGGVASATLSGGLVAGDTTFEDFVTFNSGVKFLGDTTFEGQVSFIGDANFGGLIYVGDDTAGKLEIEAGQVSRRFTFNRTYTSAPVVTLTPVDFAGEYRLKDIDTTGFTVELAEPHSSNVVFNWIALGSN